MEDETRRLLADRHEIEREWPHGPEAPTRDAASLLRHDGSARSLRFGSSMARGPSEREPL